MAVMSASESRKPLSQAFSRAGSCPFHSSDCPEWLPRKGLTTAETGATVPGCLLQSARPQGEDGTLEAESYIFGSFQLFPGQRLLLDNGKALPIGGRALDILAVLVEAAGETVANSQIMARAWPATTVEEGSLRVHIGALRKALGDGRGGNSFIANNPGRGYSFVAPVRRRKSAQPEPAAASRGNGLPMALVSIVGRAETITRLTTQLRRRRLLTIVGAGGIGKTRVAVAVAETAGAWYVDGVWFVALELLQAPDLLASTCGRRARRGRDR